MSLGESEYCLLYVKIADYSFVCYEVKNSQAWGLDTGAVAYPYPQRARTQRWC